MTTSVNDLHPLSLGGVKYEFRTPTVYDKPKMRRLLTRQGVRRPLPNELRVAAIAGIAQMAATVGDAEAGEDQIALIDEWYKLLPATDEQDVDEADMDKRAAIVAEREATRKARIKAIYPDVAAIEANLERHHPPYRELIADGNYWDDISRIDSVRLLLDRIDGQQLPRDGDELVDAAVYQAIPDPHRVDLATFAFALLAPSEAQRKN